MAYSSTIQPQPTGTSRVNVGKTERIISAVAGGLLLALGIMRMRRNPAAGVAGAVAGGFLAFRGASGYCLVNNALGRDTASGEQSALKIRETMKINVPREEVYNTWRKLENLPRFMKHLHRVEELDQKRSHWEAKIPGGITTVTWDAEIIDELEGKRLSWRSVADSTVDNAGEVIFKNAPGGGRGTLLQATISYIPPAGDVGKVIAKLLNRKFEKMVREDLRRFKTMIEAGEFSKEEIAM